MTDQERVNIKRLRNAGKSYGSIAEALGLSVNTIKTYCTRHGLGGNLAQDLPEEKEKDANCLYCGVPVLQRPGRKEKKFCSDACRNKWWNSNPDKVNRKANYDFTCPCCKKVFSSYGNKNRKYCSFDCYIKDRFGGASHE